MSNTESAITLVPRSATEAKDVASMLAPADLLPAALRKKPADVLAVVLTGAELGLGPMQSIRGIHLIEGKPSLSADLIAALVMRRGDVCEYLRVVETSAKRCVYETKRRGHPTPTSLTWTIDQAAAAGLAGRGNWAKYPDAMLRARCATAICRAVYPDLVGGLYDADELDVTPVDGRHLSVVPRGATVEGSVTPQNEAQMVEALKASIAADPPRATPPPPADYDAGGAPVSERAKIEVALNEAQTSGDVHALGARIKQLRDGGTLSAGDADAIRPLFGAALGRVSKAAQ